MQQEESAPSRSFILVLALALALFFVVLVRFSLREDLWGDEGFTMRRLEASWSQLYFPFAQRPQGMVDPFDARFVYDFNPPLYFALIRTLAGPRPGAFTVRLASILSMAGAAGLLAWCSRRALGGRAALCLLGIAITTPALIYYGHEARPYAMPLLVAVAMTGFLFDERPGPRRRFTAGAAGCAAGCLMHFAFAWFVAAYGLALVAAWIFAARRVDIEQRLREKKSALAGLLGLVAGACLAALVIYPERQILQMVSSVTTAAISPKETLRLATVPLSGVGREVGPPWITLGLQAGLAGIFAALLARSDRRRQGALILILWAVPMLMPLAMKVLFGTVVAARYALFAAPGWLLALGWLAREMHVRRGGGRRAAGLVVLALLAHNAAWCAGNLNRPLRAQWRPLIDHLAQHATPQDAYTVFPSWMNACFAANAGQPPRAAYFHPKYRTPVQARALWVLAGQSFDAFSRLHLDARQWQAAAVERRGHLTLWRVSRK